MKKTESLFVRPEDEKYIDEMKNLYVSDAEREFFEVMNHKIHHEPAWSNDLLLSHDDNEDNLYIVRLYDSEFILGRLKEGNFSEELHTMTFSELMHTNLKEKGFLDCDITLADWLRKRNYAGIKYDHNFDLM